LQKKDVEVLKWNNYKTENKNRNLWKYTVSYETISYWELFFILDIGKLKTKLTINNLIRSIPYLHIHRTLICAIPSSPRASLEIFLEVACIDDNTS